MSDGSWRIEELTANGTVGPMFASGAVVLVTFTKLEAAFKPRDSTPGCSTITALTSVAKQVPSQRLVARPSDFTRPCSVTYEWTAFKTLQLVGCPIRILILPFDFMYEQKISEAGPHQEQGMLEEHTQSYWKFFICTMSLTCTRS